MTPTTRKDILFSVFISVFCVFALIAVLGVLKLVSIDAFYLNALFSAIILDLIAAVIFVFKNTDFFGETKHPQPTITVVPKTTTEQQTSEQQLLTKGDPEIPNEELGPSTPQEYFDTLKLLEKRFAEHEDYISRMNGKTIHWKCYVCSVTGCYKGGASITLNPNGAEATINVIYLQVPKECRERAFRLSPGDLISFKCKLNTRISCAPHLEADDFKREEYAKPQQQPTPLDNVVTLLENIQLAANGTPSSANNLDSSRSKKTRTAARH